jgi:protein-tyrosine phosphatase
MDYDSDVASNEVPDPYYGGPDGFELMFALIDSAIGCMLDDLRDDDD